jgi:hypothetical protein
LLQRLHRFSDRHRQIAPYRRDGASNFTMGQEQLTLCGSMRPIRPAFMVPAKFCLALRRTNSSGRMSQCRFRVFTVTLHRNPARCVRHHLGVR